MNIPWNWGTKLTLFIIIFILFILILVYKTFQNNIMLVEKDYYPKGLKYQDKIDEMRNAAPLSPAFYFRQTQQYIELHMAAIEPDTGSITFFRPSDNSLDLVYNLTPDTNFSMRFPIDKFKKGKYLAKIYWKESDNGYYVEKAFYFN